MAVTENDATELAASTVSGTFDITSGGAITNSGALAITGASTFTNTDGTNDAITLNNAGNAFTGTVGFTTDSGSAVTVVDTRTDLIFRHCGSKLERDSIWRCYRQRNLGDHWGNHD